MKILFLEWKSYCVPDMIEALETAGHYVTLITCKEMTDRYNTEFEKIFNSYIEQVSYDAVLHLTIFPLFLKCVINLIYYIFHGYTIILW